jgi:hypothetical protein
MQIRSPEFFRHWLAEVGIGVDPRYPASEVLTFTASPDLSRFWLPHEVPSDLPGFILKAARLASSNGTSWLQLRGGGAWYRGSDASSREEVIHRLLPAAGISPGTEGALGFTDSEWQALVIVVTAFYTFGWHTGNDLHLIPADRSCILMFGHHGEMTCSCATSERLEAFVSEMAAAGYSLPDYLPDETFKRPDWMPPDGTA